ncbi:ABC transporter permease subunit [Alkalihalobacillus sp. AL-G]|uniref:ABC transporter permease subunit n=1 Tax=Alkalihalobacillus sp. AL-G TaxID=2926399 RepID=UPI00272DC0D7|nr:ABC transporter permease subunit [Alkalihalobacillus sp. AL-G]WLD92590.1 ABC transporter permease subunit [Alkalihalobacillus sp. AL-G]
MKFSVENYFDKLRSIMLGVILISFLPSLIHGIDQKVNLWEYTLNDKTYSLFPDLFEKYFYSMTIFMGALLVGLCFAIFFTFCTSILHHRLKRMIYGLISLFESLPDIFIVIVLQLTIVYIYQKTGLLIANVTTLYDDKIYLLPILTLSVLPTIQLFKITFLLMNEEQDKPYITVAKSMGLSDHYILIRHVFKNVLFNLFLYFKTIFVFMLSNLFIMEYVFNIHGIMMTMLSFNSFMFFISVMLIAIPFTFLFELAQSFIYQSTGKNEEGAA